MPFSCKYAGCPEVFDSVQARYYHVRMNHKQNMGKPLPQCTRCAQTYLYPSRVLQHELEMHRDVAAAGAAVDMAELTCTWPFCGKVYTRKDSLEEHMNTHTDRRPFGCPKCSNFYHFRKQAYLCKNSHQPAASSSNAEV